MATATELKGSTFVHRLVGASLLDAATYEELEADPRATMQAVVVVLLSSAATGFAARGFGTQGFAAVVFFPFVALVAWVAWSAVIYQVGVGLVPDIDTRADIGQVL